jgi:hypothetical protein
MSDALRANGPDRGNYSDMSAALRANGPDRGNYSDMSEKWARYPGVGGRRVARRGAAGGATDGGRRTVAARGLTGQPRISST